MMRMDFSMLLLRLKLCVAIMIGGAIVAHVAILCNYQRVTLVVLNAKRRKNCVPKYRVVVNVEDWTGDAIFILFNLSAAMMIKRKLKDALEEFEADYLVAIRPPNPPIFDSIIGKEVVFRVERRQAGYAPYNGTFKVVNCCDDREIVSKFKKNPKSRRIVKSPVLSVLYEDGVQRPHPHDDIPPLATRLFIDDEDIDMDDEIEIDKEGLASTVDISKPDPSLLLFGTITRVLNDKRRWYSICLCGEKIEADQASPFCKSCFTHCADGILRYKVRVFVAHSGGYNMLILHDKDVSFLMKKKCCDILKADPSFGLGESFCSDGSMILSELVDKKIVMMVDPQPIEDISICPAFNVYRVSDDASLIKLFELADVRVLLAERLGDSSLKEDSLPKSPSSSVPSRTIDTVSIHAPEHIVCNKRVASSYACVPRSLKRKLDDAFKSCVRSINSDDDEDHGDYDA